MKSYLKLLPLLLLTACGTTTKVGIERLSTTTTHQTNEFGIVSSTTVTNFSRAWMDRHSDSRVGIGKLSFNTNGTFDLEGYANEGNAEQLGIIVKGLGDMLNKLGEGLAKGGVKGMKGGL